MICNERVSMRRRVLGDRTIARAILRRGVSIVRKIVFIDLCMYVRMYVFSKEKYPESR